MCCEWSPDNAVSNSILAVSSLKRTGGFVLISVPQWERVAAGNRFWAWEPIDQQSRCQGSSAACAAPFLQATWVVPELVTRTGVSSCSRSAAAIARDSRVGSSSPDTAMGSAFAPRPPLLPQPGLPPALFAPLVLWALVKRRR